MPHLTKLQQKYKDQGLVVVGVSIDSEKTVGKVKPFVAKSGDTMDYTVAIDKDGATRKAYMDAHYVGTIPHAFIVDQSGRIVWNGDPRKELEEKLEQVAKGKFDLAAEKKRMAPVYAERRKAWERNELTKEYFRLVQYSGDNREAEKLGRKILEGGRDDAVFMNAFAWDILTKEGIVSRDLKLALAAAEAANQASKEENPAILDTYALALFENDRKEQALEVQTKAVKLARKDPAAEPMLAELEERLERFRKELD